MRLIDSDALLNGLYNDRPKDVFGYIAGFPVADVRETTTWLGNYCPYTCQHCGKHTDSKTPYCAWCGRRANNYED